jgi:hypothetical protein
MNMIMYKPTKLKGNQQGFASIVIALVLIVVLALLTVGFAQLARGEQQSALDKQLATQATDAAESGINDAYSDIQNCYIYSANTCGHTPGNTSNTSCMHLSSPAKTANQTINSADEVDYSCLLVDLNPPNIEYSDVDPGTSEHLTFSTSPAATSFTVLWGSADSTPHNNFPNDTSGDFPSTSNWGNKPPVIEFSITPLNDLSRAGMIANSFTAYLYPSIPSVPSNNTYTYHPGIGNGTGADTAEDGPILGGSCNATTNATYPCSATISGFGDFGFAGPYVVNVLVYYDAANIIIYGQNSLGQPSDIVDGQAQIDVTGQAKNVLKRIQVRVPLSASGSASSGVLPQALAGQNICKREQTGPYDLIKNPDGTTYSDPTGANRKACSFGGLINP